MFDDETTGMPAGDEAVEETTEAEDSAPEGTAPEGDEAAS